MLEKMFNKFFDCSVFCFFACVFGGVGFVEAAPPTQVCTAVEIDVKAVRDGDDNPILRWSGELALQYAQNFHTLHLTTHAFSLTNTTANDNHDLQILPDFTAKGISCYAYANQSCSIVIGNTSVSVVNVFKVNSSFDSVKFAFFESVVDSGGFSQLSGSFYPTGCVNKTKYYDYGYKTDVRQCCSKFESLTTSVPVPPPRACSVFSNRVIYYKNRRPVATLSASFSVMDSFIFIDGAFNGSNDVATSFSLKENYENQVVVNSSSGNFKFLPPFESKQDGKYLYTVHKYFKQVSDSVRDDAMLAARIIVRGGAMEMEEGRPFTFEDNCDYFSATISNDTVATSEFCCTVFFFGD